VQGILVSLGVMLVCFVFLIVAQMSGYVPTAVASEVNSPLTDAALYIAAHLSDYQKHKANQHYAQADQNSLHN
jgi:hypothetical protein